MAKKGEPAGLAPRLLSAARLGEVLRGAQFQPFTAAEIADSRDRALANRLVTTALRRNGHIDLILGETLDRGLPQKGGSFEAVLRLALGQLVYLPDAGSHSAIFLAVETLKRDRKAQHLTGLMNAVLRRAQANSARYWTLDPSLLIPSGLRELWSAAYGEDAIPAFGDALLEGAPLDLTLRDEDPGLMAELGAEPVMADTVRILSRDKPVDALPGYEAGRWWVQDAAAAMPARLLQLPAGAAVLDLCAAPGGKAAQLIKAGYRVTLVDNDAERMERVRSNVSRLGYAAELAIADAGSFRPPAPADGVLLDAPCSASGTFRRHPEVLLRGGGGVPARVELQRRLIANAAQCLKPGGRLVYCVCSLEPDEGEEQARWARSRLGLEPVPIGAAEVPGLPGAVTAEGFLRTHPGLAVPGAAGGTLDGFFAARFRRAES